MKKTRMRIDCRNTLALSWMVLAALGCQSEPPPESAAPAEVVDAGQDFVTPIETAHSHEAWRGQEAFRSGISVRFGGNTVVEGRMLMTPSMSRTRLDLASGASAVWDGEEVWVSPADAEFPEARFHALTWPYFLSAPMKLRDPGTRLESLGVKTLRGESFETAKLTFDAGVGDTPDDWYVLYRHPENGRLAAMAYIVTFGTSREEAEKEPHAVTYDEFEDVSGVPIPTRWTFWMWSEEEGIHGEPIGGVTLENPEFVTPGAEEFAVPEGAVKAELPGAAPR